MNEHCESAMNDCTNTRSRSTRTTGQESVAKH